MSAAKPGGVPVAIPTGVSRERHDAVRQAAYMAYLRRIGHADEAAAYRAEAANGAILHDAAMRLINPKNIFDAPRSVLDSVIALWGFGLSVLASLLVAVLLGVVAGIAMRLRVIASGGELSPRGKASFVVGLVVAVSLVAVAACLVSTHAARFVGTAYDICAGDADRFGVAKHVGAGLVVALGIVAPVLIIVSSVVLMRRGRPGSLAVVQSARSIASTLTLAFTIIYAVTVLATTPLEIKACHYIDAGSTGRSWYATLATGKPWPGLVP